MAHLTTLRTTAAAVILGAMAKELDPIFARIVNDAVRGKSGQ
jgi:hypothetical protein